MACTREELQEKIRSVPMLRNGNAKYSAELRCEIIDYSKRLMAQGQSQQSIAVELGMKGWTLNRWHQNIRAAKEPRFVEVSTRKMEVGRRAVPSQEAAFELKSPSGFEVRVPAVFSSSALRALLSAIEGR